MARRLGRWQLLLVDALAEQETVAVQTVVEEHLDRRASRSELNAAQRAAHLLARRGGATIGYVTVPAGIRRSRLAVSRPPERLDGWLDEEDGPAARPDVVRWLPPATPASESPARFGRWQQVIMDALDQYEVVGLRAVVEGHRICWPGGAVPRSVTSRCGPGSADSGWRFLGPGTGQVGLRAVVEGHLGRRAERAESTAAQRAARLLARSGQVRLAHVRLPATKDRKGAELLVVARAEVDPAAMTDEAMRTIAILHVASADPTRESLEAIVAAVRQAAAQVADVDLHTVDGDDATRSDRGLPPSVAATIDEIQLHTVEANEAREVRTPWRSPLRQVTQPRQSLMRTADPKLGSGRRRFEQMFEPVVQ